MTRCRNMNNRWVDETMKNGIHKRRVLIPKKEPQGKVSPSANSHCDALKKETGKPSTKALSNQTATGSNNIQISADTVNLTIINEGDSLRDSVKTEERK